MAICSESLGYNWVGQASLIEINDKPPLTRECDEDSYPLAANILKVMDYIPILSVISGIFKIALAATNLANWKDLSHLDRADAVILLGRGIMATCQLGSIFLVIDPLMSILNGVLSWNVKKQAMDVIECA